MYPKWKYHSEYEALIVHDEAQEKKLGAEWKESPTECGRPESAPALDPLKLRPKAKK